MHRPRRKLARRRTAQDQKGPAVQRRLGCWRFLILFDRSLGRIVRNKVYVDLRGYVHNQPGCFKESKQERTVLKALNVHSTEAPLGYDKFKQISDSSCQIPLTHWDLPEAVAMAYAEQMGVCDLFEWQALALRQCLEENGQRREYPRSLLTFAPTSGGKTLVADILSLRELCLYGRVGLSVYPHIALCTEKYNDLSLLFGNDQTVASRSAYKCQCMALRVGAFFSSNAVPGSWDASVDLSICTAEKANSILNRLLLERPLDGSSRLELESGLLKGIATKQERDSVLGLLSDPLLVSRIRKSIEQNAALHPIGQLGVVTIDEIHEIGAKGSRGHLIEILLAKLIYIKKWQKDNGMRPLQIVALSGTLGSPAQFAEWLDAELVEVCSRPQKLLFYYQDAKSLYHFVPNSVEALADEARRKTADATEVTAELKTGLTATSMVEESGILAGAWQPIENLPSTIHSLDLSNLTAELKQQIPPGLQAALPLEKPMQVNDVAHAAQRCSDLWLDLGNDGIIIFCPSRMWTEKLAVSLARMLPVVCLAPNVEESATGQNPVADLTEKIALMASLMQATAPLAEELKRSSAPEDPPADLMKCLPFGVAYHHGMLASNARRLVEEAFKKRVLRIICATSTLAMGVNLPVTRVMFRQLDLNSPLMDSKQFHQMAGRAGRCLKGSSKRPGEIYILEAKNASVLKGLPGALRDLISSPQPPCNSPLSELSLCRCILEVLVLKRFWTYRSLIATLNSITLAGRQRPPEVFEDQVRAALGFLCAQQCVVRDLNFQAGTKTLSRVYMMSCSCIPLVLCSLFRHLPANPGPPTAGATATAGMRMTVDGGSNRETGKPDFLCTVLSEAWSRFTGLFKETPEQMHERLNCQIFNVPCQSRLFNLCPPSTVQWKLDDVLFLTPLGRAFIESGLRLGEAFECFSSLACVYWQGFNVESLLPFMALSVPFGLFQSQNWQPNWSMAAEFLERCEARNLRIMADLMEVSPILLRTMHRVGAKTPDVDQLYDEVLSKGLVADVLRRVRIVWSCARFSVAMVLYDLHELENPAIVVARRWNFGLSKIQALRRQISITSGILSNLTKALELPELSALFRKVSELCRAQESPVPILQFLHELPSLRYGDRANAFYQAGLTDPACVAKASIEEIAGILEELYPFNLRSDSPEVAQKVEQRQRLARLIHEEATYYSLQHPDGASQPFFDRVA